MLEKLIKLAEEWRDFSRSVNGWLSVRYEGVNCYFAANSDHASVRFDIKSWNGSRDMIEVSFHFTPIVGGFTVRSEKFIKEAIVKYTNLLAITKEEYSKKDEVEIENDKHDRIDALKRQLEELEG